MTALYDYMFFGLHKERNTRRFGCSLPVSNIEFTGSHYIPFTVITSRFVKLNKETELIQWVPLINSKNVKIEKQPDNEKETLLLKRKEYKILSGVYNKQCALKVIITVN